MNQEISKIKFVTIESNNTISDEIKPIIHNKNSRRHKTKIVLSRTEYEEIKITWQLRKFIKISEPDGVEWFYQSSAQELTNGITTKEIVTLLNQKNVFDFPYEPNQNDVLIIKLEYVIQSIKNKYTRPYIDQYISFLYNDGLWKINEGYDSIDFILEDYKEGIIENIL